MATSGDVPVVSLPCARPDVLVAGIDGELVLFDPRRERAHRLNASAAAVWVGLDGTRSTADLAIALAEQFDAPPARVTDDVDATIERLAAEGLLHTTDAAGLDERATTATGIHTEQGAGVDPLPVAATTRSATVQALASRVAFATSDPACAAALERLLAPLLVQTGNHTGNDDEATVYEVAADDTAAELRRDGVVLSRRRTWPQLVRELVVELNRIATHPDAPIVCLHAAAVAIDGAGMVLPAQPESGKSTLVTALVRDGLTYLSDEAVGIEAHGAPLALIPYPKPIALDQGSWRLFADLEPDDAQDAAMRVGTGQWLLDPTTLGAGSVAAPDARTPLRAIVFPRYAPDDAAGLTPLAPIDTLMTLLPNVFNLGAVGQTGLDTLAEIARTVPAATLAVDDLARAVTDVRHAAALAATTG